MPYRSGEGVGRDSISSVLASLLLNGFLDSGRFASLRLVRFKVSMYRSIRETPEIPLDKDITTFVGINESGKTNILRALRKLNSLTDTTFNDLTEHPMWDYGNFNPEAIFVTGTFSLNDSEQKEVAGLDSAYSHLKEISFSRKKNMQLVCHLKGDQIAIPMASFSKTYLAPISTVIQEIEYASIPDGAARKKKLSDDLLEIGKGLGEEMNIRQPTILGTIKKQIEVLRKDINAIPREQYNTQPLNELIEKILSEVKEDGTENVKNYLIKQLPRFIYFENIAIIDSRIHLPTFLQKLEANELNEDDRTAKTLLDLARLDPKELVTLSQEKGKDQKAIRSDKDRLQIMSSLASKRLTDQIDAIWSQNDHNVEIIVDGNYLRVWITNRADGTRLQLEERSRGYQWYFSFYVVFSVESEGAHKDAILLLDEPALFLHALGQEDFLKKTLPKLAEKNQIIYTTHSPFLIDLAKPESIHTVTIDDSHNKETVVSVDSWASDRGALFPMQSALGYYMSQSMFIGSRNLIVEGLTDFWILSSVSELLRANGKAPLGDNFAFSPAGGATKTVLLATMYVGQKLGVWVLLDSDSEGKQALSMLSRLRILKDNRILLLNEALNRPNEAMTIEDIFPEDYYLKFVEITYQKELSGRKIVLDKGDSPLVKRIEAFFERNGLGDFHKSRPARAIMKEFASTSTERLPPQLVTNLVTLVGAINEAMK